MAETVPTIDIPTTADEDTQVSVESLIEFHRISMEVNFSGLYTQHLRDKIFDDQVAITEALVKDATQRGIYNPWRVRRSSANSKVDCEQSVLPGAIDDGLIYQPTPNGHKKWDTEKLEPPAERVMQLYPRLLRRVQRLLEDFDGFNREDSEDALSNGIERFLEFLNKSDYTTSPEDNIDEMEKKMMFKFAKYATIDYVRQVKGRKGQKLTPVSIFEEGTDGLTLEDKLETKDPFSLETSIDDRSEFIKNALPFLDRRERSILVMNLHFGMVNSDIGGVLGVTESRICQIYGKIKQKLIHLVNKQIIPL